MSAVRVLVSSPMGSCNVGDQISHAVYKKLFYIQKKEEFVSQKGKKHEI